LCSVLIIEDHSDTREAIAEIIGDVGHVHHGAANGREAIDWLERQIELPCLILLDLRMPVMDGWDFLRVIRTMPRLSGIPIIVISANIEHEAPSPVLPANAFWTKPPHIDLIASMHRHCDRHRDSWKRATKAD
jgi:CheY-like chemotaxis protein